MKRTVLPIRKVVIKSEEQRLVYGEVYAPLHLDTDGEAMSREEIQKMAHSFLARGKTDKIDVSHDQQESGCLVVESFLARKNDPDGFIEGSWVLGVIIQPDHLWAAVKRGELNGFSFFGNAKRVPVTVKVKVAKRMIGKTEQSLDDQILPPHEHSIDLAFLDNGQIAPGRTGETLGHTHEVRKATATEMEMDHAHRMILIDS